MKHLRRVGGIVLLLAGTVGLTLSLIAIREVHDASVNASRQASELLDSSREAVGFLKQGTTKTQNLLGETRSRVAGLDATLEGIAKKVKKSTLEKTLLDTLDENVVKQLQRAQSTLASLKSTIEGFHNSLVLFSSLEGLSKSDTAAAPRDGEIPELSRVLLEASENLDHINQFLNEVLTDREVTLQSLTEVMVWVERIQGRLADAESRVDGLRRRLTSTEDRIQTSQRTVPAGIDRGSRFVMVMLACFAFTQIGLMIQAVSMLRKPRVEGPRVDD